VSATGPIVTTSYTDTITGSPATVSANATAAAAVTYAPRPGSGGLWVLNYDINFSQYTAAQLGSSTSAAPAASIGVVGTNYKAMAFDSAGNLWVADVVANAVAEYPASQLAAGGSPTPTVTLTAAAGSLLNPCALAFDAQGNLWVANSGGGNIPGVNTIVAYSPGQRASSGSPPPAVVVSANKGSLNMPCALAFDHSGDLWVGNQAGFTIVEYGANQLSAGGSLPPVVTLNLPAPVALGFDSTGDLWVGVYNFGLAELSPAQLAASGSPTPTVTIVGHGSPLGELTGLAFDNSGDLWVANGGPMTTTVMEFTASQVATGGSPVPPVILSGVGVENPVALAFNPHASNLPLRP
jgi:ligand-binding sensor domain-containing protein